MTTGESRRTPQDLTYVSLEREEDRLYWTNRFNVSGDELAEAVETVGNDVDAVAAYLNVGR
ncbi:DUF3606 domain-containing protein [Sphingobium lactosutens]|jgi:hypothetical protein|nr:MULTISPECIES: DUF3606 domain-containing protein [unclassified Sphingobium]MCC4257750.1 DUF3606 domain-containing protein [Sphingobium lactosutens]MEC9016919.1 DUF3606 domain-containing protein [Pseudomonadota bacterium]MBS50916.1 DUF3606 domain-containing protein [Sphingobium sp.]MEE2740608.1 DUF3606 domain-containing protein [Pseudomonadota bacterium]HCW62791.1 DUF3606 domain-containing protein [Sphingobium sp.]|tara:strand:- start:1193 stop:1375 length:183 start_codon:yes stop_codon:yes gene_type:complete